MASSRLADCKTMTADAAPVSVDDRNHPGSVQQRSNASPPDGDYSEFKMKRRFAASAGARSSCRAW